MTETMPVPIRERTRRSIQTELTSVAQDLFVAQGYEGTTIEQIAAAAGMSRRTFFRYFPSRDDLVIGKYDLFGDRMAEALTNAPWASQSGNPCAACSTSHSITSKMITNVHETTQWMRSCEAAHS